jgi:hypothetical protein
LVEVHAKQAAGGKCIGIGFKVLGHGAVAGVEEKLHHRANDRYDEHNAPCNL